MDEFSWFVGLYEGEGCVIAASKPGRKEGRENRYWNLCICIKMTDEEPIARAAKLLGVSYKVTKEPSRVGKGHKPIYRVRKSGGLKGELYDLMMRMKPHLCQRRQEQFDAVIEKVRNGLKS